MIHQAIPKTGSEQRTDQPETTAFSARPSDRPTHRHSDGAPQAGHNFADVAVHRPDHRPAVHVQPQAPANQTGLPDALKASVEQLAGLSLDDVRVHYNSAKPQQLDALAFTQGRDIHVAPGQELHLPHEAWHVVQQAQGRVVPTTHLQHGGTVNDDINLEREADAMAAKVPVAGHFTRQPVLSPMPTGATLGQQMVSASKGAAVMQLRKITFSEAKETIDTEDYTAEQLRALIAKHDKHDPDAVKQLTAAIEAGEYRRDMAFVGSQTNMEAWAGSHSELAGSHHKFPKRTLAWLHSKMTPEQKRSLNRKLDLTEDAGPKALARLRSNLIPWGPNQVASDTRSDDPEHTGEGLDIVRDTSGAMTPRSARYAKLADTYQSIKDRLDRTGHPQESMTDEEAGQVADHLYQAELHHYSIEQNPELPADYGAEFWQKQDGPRPWSKGRVQAEKYQGKELDIAKYQAAKKKEKEEAEQRQEAALESAANAERAPHGERYRRMGKSERLGMATMGKRKEPKEGTYSSVVGSARHQHEADLYSAVFRKVGPQLDPAEVKIVQERVGELSHKHQRMMQAQHAAWKDNSPNAHEIGRKDYEDSVDSLAEELAEQIRKGKSPKDDSRTNAEL